MNLEVYCPRGHRLTRWESQPCAGGHDHQVAVCPLRVGSRRCGEIVVVPPYGAACEDDDDES